MRFECVVVVVVAGSPRYLNFPPIFVFYERDLVGLWCDAQSEPTNQGPEGANVRRAGEAGCSLLTTIPSTQYHHSELPQLLL